MRKSQVLWLLLASAAASGLAATTANAVDMPPPPPPPPEYYPTFHDWSGPYIGVLGTVGFLETDYTPIPGPDPELNGGGGMFGAMAGYNFQMGTFVGGIEGDFSYGQINARNTLDGVGYDIGWLATVRGRIGYAADRTLYYATGGLAIAEGEMKLPAFGESETETHYGFVVGAGLEHAFLDDVSFRLEYLYAQLDKQRYNFSAGVVDTALDDLHLVRAGVAWYLNPHY